LTDDLHRDRMPSWSPDEKRIAFSSNRTGKYEVWVINADGGGLRQLTQIPGADVTAPVWSPDGTRLACRLFGGDPIIIEASKAWRDQRPDALPPLGKQDVSFGTPSWSSDGKKLAGDLRRAQGNCSGLVVYSFANRKYEQLTEFGSRPSWLSDNRRLVLLYLLDTQSRRVRKIYSAAPRLIEQHNRLGVSRDDHWIYFSAATNEADVWLMTLK
jgi:Tol biopolymer transport system component